MFGPELRMLVLISVIAYYVWVWNISQSHVDRHPQSNGITLEYCFSDFYYCSNHKKLLHGVPAWFCCRYNTDTRNVNWLRYEHDLRMQQHPIFQYIEYLGFTVLVQIACQNGSCLVCCFPSPCFSCLTLHSARLTYVILPPKNRAYRVQYMSRNIVHNQRMALVPLIHSSMTLSHERR